MSIFSRGEIYFNEFYMQNEFLSAVLIKSKRQGIMNLCCNQHFQVFSFNPAKGVWQQEDGLKQGRRDALFFSVHKERLLCE